MPDQILENMRTKQQELSPRTMDPVVALSRASLSPITTEPTSSAQSTTAKPQHKPTRPKKESASNEKLKAAVQKGNYILKSLRQTFRNRLKFVLRNHFQKILTTVVDQSNAFINKV